MQGADQSQPRPVFLEAVHTLQDPSYDPESNDHQLIHNLLRHSEFLKRALETPVLLNEFAHLAKSHFKYEVYRYGDILMKPQEYAQKFGIVLRGQLQRLHHRPYNEVEQEIRENEQNEITQRQDTSEHHHSISNLPQTNSVDLTNRFTRKRTLTWLTFEAPKNASTNSVDMPSTELTLTHESPKPKTFAKMKTLPSLAELELECSMPPEQNLDMKRVSSVPRKQRRSISKKVTLKKKEEAGTEMQKEAMVVRPSLVRCNTIKSITSIDDFGDKASRSPRKESSRLFDERRIGSRGSLVMREDKGHVAFVQYLANKHPELKQKCFSKDVVLLTQTKVYESGFAFGENVCKEEQPKESSYTVVSSEEVHLLTIKRSSYRKFIEVIAEQTAEKTRFLKVNFPEFEEEVIKNFSKYLSKRTLQKDDVIFRQHEYTRELFLVATGVVKLTKEGSLCSQTELNTLSKAVLACKRVELPIAVISENQLFGEELLLGTKRRQYTAIVNVADTELYCLEAFLYEKVKDKFREFFWILREQAQQRFQWRQERASALARQQHKRSKKLLSEINIVRTQLPISLNDSPSGSPTLKLPSAMTTTAAKGLGSSRAKSTTDLKTVVAAATPNTGIYSLGAPEHFFMSRSLDIYKKKFSRKFNVPASNNDVQNFENEEKEEQSKKAVPKESLKISLTGFNIRKELEEFNMDLISPIKAILTRRSSPMTQRNSYNASKVVEVKPVDGSSSPLLKAQKITVEKMQKLAKFSYFPTEKLAEPPSYPLSSRTVSPRGNMKGITMSPLRLVKGNEGKDGPSSVGVKKLLKMVKYNSGVGSVNEEVPSPKLKKKEFVNYHMRAKSIQGL